MTFIHKEIIKIVGEIDNTATNPIITINFLRQFLGYSCLIKKKTRQSGAGYFTGGALSTNLVNPKYLAGQTSQMNNAHGLCIEHYLCQNRHP